MTKRRKGCVARVMMPIVGLVVAAALVVVATNAATVVSTRDRISDDAARVAALLGELVEGTPEFEGSSGEDVLADAIVVLGAAVKPNGQPSGILQDRLDCGVKMYFAGVAPKILVSGDNGTATYNEVAAMKRYVVAQGVPSEDVFCDHAGFSTYESMYRAKYVFGCERIVVATQTYHLYRALYAAQGLGMQAVGASSDYHTYGGQLWFSTRETLARVKDFVKVIFKPESTFVGDFISLDQSGDVTNG